MLTRQVFRLIASASFIGASVWACSGGTGNTGFGGDTSTSNNGNSSNNNSTNSGGNSSYSGGGTTTNGGGGTTTGGGGTTTTGGGGSSTAASSSIVGGTSGTGCAAAAGSIYAPASCDATNAGSAQAASNCYYTGTTGTAAMGYVYPYGDGTSTACVDSAAICGKGSVGAANPPTYSVYGSGFGINVNQASGASTSGSVTPTATGLTWAVSGTMPLYGIQISITAGTGPCAAASGCCFRPATTATSGTTPWSMFTQACFNPAEAGAGLSGSDQISKINFQAISGTAATTFDFCVTSLAF